MKYLIFTALFLFTLPAMAQINIFTEHELIHMVRSGTHSDRFPTGKLPYIGKLGFEYERTDRISYHIAYIHRSNADLVNQNEYNYDGVVVGIRLKHCFALCD